MKMNHVLLGLAFLLVTSCGQDNPRRDTLEGYLQFKDTTSMAAEDYLADLLHADAERFSALAKASTGIVKVEVSQGGMSTVCSGWMITKRHVVTNQHCVKENYWDVPADYNKADDYDSTACSQFHIITGYQTANPSLRQSGQYSPPDQTTVPCSRILVANQSRDVALIELRGDIPASVNPLAPLSGFEPNGQRIALVGHPGGMQKQAYHYNRLGGSIHECAAIPMAYPPGKGPADDPHPWHDVKNPNSFVHTCEGPGGTSGSAVLEYQSGKVLGLHWNDSNDCTWGHYKPQNEGGIWDSKAEQYYQPGSRAISVEAIHAYFSTLHQVPSEVLAAFGG